jgi:segregation and condensation protein A
MAATLAHIKSKMLLPLPPPGQEDEVIEEEEEDPREALIRRLLEYQKYKLASQELEAKGIAAQNVFLRGGKIEEELESGVPPLAQIPLFRLIEAFQGVLAKSKITITHDIVADRISITDRIHELAAILEVKRHTLFEELFEGLTSKFDLVITFLALLEPEGPDGPPDLSDMSPADVDDPLSVPAEPLSDAGPPPDLERGSHAADQDDPPDLSDDLHDGGVSDLSDDEEHFEISDDPELAMLEEEAADGPSDDDAWTTDAALVDDGPNAVEVPETVTATISDANASADAVPLTEVGEADGEADEAPALAPEALTSNDSDVPARPVSAPVGSDDVRLEAVTGGAETVTQMHTTDASEGSPSGSEPIREPTDSVPSAIASKPSYAEADPDAVPPAVAPPSRPEREPAEAPDFVEKPEPAPELEPESPPDFEPGKAPEFVPEPEPAPELEPRRAPEFEPTTFPEFVPEPLPELEPRTPAEIEPQTAPEFDPATPPELVPEPERAPELEPDTRPAAPEFEPTTTPELLPEPGAPEIEPRTQPEIEPYTRPTAPEFEPATFPEFVPRANGPDPVSELAPPARTTEIDPRTDRPHAELVEAATPVEAELEDAVAAAESPASFSEHENEDADGALLSDPEGPDEPTP